MQDSVKQDRKKEEWKKVEGFPNYSVSNLGRVRNDKKNKLLILNDSKGYMRVTLYHDGLSRRTLVHRLVATAFIPNPDNKPQVNHIDGNKKNNCVTNLEWVTAQENVIHSFKVLGRVASEVQRKAVADSNRHRVITDSTREKISKRLKGRVVSEETRTKLSLAHKGKRQGSNSPLSKKVMCFETGEVFGCLSDASKATQISVSGISQACTGKIPHIKGTHWKYI
jgi:hypothetical protein